jgi:hypothetical protein
MIHVPLAPCAPNTLRQCASSQLDCKFAHGRDRVLLLLRGVSASLNWSSKVLNEENSNCNTREC